MVFKLAFLAFILTFAFAISVPPCEPSLPGLTKNPSSVSSAPSSANSTSSSTRSSSAITSASNSSVRTSSQISSISSTSGISGLSLSSVTSHSSSSQPTSSVKSTSSGSASTQKSTVSSISSSVSSKVSSSFSGQSLPTSSFQSQTSSTTSLSRSSSSTSSSASSTPSNFISGKGVKGINWNPYKGTVVGGNSQKSCKTASEITTDIKQLLSYSWNTIRIYDTVDCNSINVTMNAMAGTSAKVIIGVNNLQTLNADTASMVAQVNGRWSQVAYITVIDGSTTNAKQIKQAMSYIRSQVPKGTLLTTVVEFSQYSSSLCNVGQDFIAASVEPWNYGVTVAQAGTFVLQSQQLVESICRTRSVSIVEAGWPNQGVGVGKSGAVGSTGQNSQSQFVAVSNIISALSGNVIVYEAFNDYYVVDTSTRKGQGRFGLYTSSSPGN